MRTVEEIADEMDHQAAAEGETLDWDASGSIGWQTVKRLVELAQEEAVEEEKKKHADVYPDRR